MDAGEYLRLALDPDRLAVLGLLAIEHRDVDALVAETGQRRREVLGVLGLLAAAGLASETEGTWALDRQALRRIAGDLPSAPDADQQVLYGMTADEQTVLARFFQGSRLVEIPAARAKRRVVLERLALEFEPGIYYPEPEVNEILGAYHPDYATLRRHLVDEGLLSRSEGRYWRSGGRVG